jgi:hypothetical protein
MVSRYYVADGDAAIVSISFFISLFLQSPVHFCSTAFLPFSLFLSSLQGIAVILEQGPVSFIPFSFLFFLLQIPCPLGGLHFLLLP